VGRSLRLLLVGLVVAACAVEVAPATVAGSCRATPSDGAGPFGRGTPPQRAKIGTGHVLTGVVLSAVDCKPLARARVELWQANRSGTYLRARSGTVFTDGTGRFRFEGPPPVSYEGRPPHIHLRVFARGHEVLLSRYVRSPGARRGSVRLVLEPALV
jgi:protocatechuate 3,4-dioxygenase beta subunit